MGERQKATLKQVAELSGFSTTSVSMILNGGFDRSFSGETVERVLAAADSIGYSRRAARAAGKKVQNDGREGGIVAVLCPNISNPYYATLFQAIESAARENNFLALALNSYRSMEAEAANLKFAISAKVSGFIFAMKPLVYDPLAFLGTGMPAVAIGDRGCSQGIDAVEMDNFGAGALLARHLAELGHEHIAYISTTLDDANNMRQRRLKGLEESFLAACPHGSVLVKSRKVTPEEELKNLFIEHEVGFALTKECLADKGISAIVAINDMVAYGAIDAILSEGLSVPRDYSVCGFDNIFPSRLAPISLTTVDNYIVEKGRNAFTMLLARIRDGSKAGEAGPQVITRVEYQPRLVVRTSTSQRRNLD
ncbi:MAG: LacI family DNA-binding transcriptional regulator [Spirochaetes bacterium]|nr:LacI family DNA-binding transcriptional regulator [Spirochaetota bacterium]